MRKKVSLGLMVAWLTAAPAMAGDQAALLKPDDAAIVNQGEGLYAEHCAACHCADLEGEPDWRIRKADGKMPAPPQDESGHTWHHPDDQLFALTKEGIAAFAGANYKTDMMGFGDVMTDDEIIAVLSFIKSRWPPEIQKRHDEINAGHGHSN